MRSLREARSHLLQVHKSLIDAERRRLERARGRMADGEFLQALAADAELAWLRPMTRLLAGMDAFLDDREFHARYARALQESPEVAAAHGLTMTPSIRRAA